MALVEHGGGHHHHRHVDGARQQQGRDDLAVRIAQEQPALARVAGGRAILRQAGVEIDRVRHDGRADDRDRQGDGLGVRELREDRVQRRPPPIRRGDEEFGDVAEGDDAHEAAYDQLERAEAAAVEKQDAGYDDCGHEHARQQRQAEQEREADGAAEKLGQVGRHGRDLAHDPHGEHDRPGKMGAAELGEVAVGGDAEPSGQRLEQHGDDVGEQDDPEQPVTVAGTRLDVGREVAGIDIGDGRDHGRTQERGDGPQAPAAARQRLANRDRRAFRQTRNRHFASVRARSPMHTKM